MIIKRIFSLSLAILLLICLVACQAENGGETDTITESVSERISDTDETVSEDESSDTSETTETSSQEASTDDSTEEESTEEKSTEDESGETAHPLYVMDLDDAEGLSKDFFSKSLNCKVSVLNDETEGQFFRLTASNLAGAAGVKFPATYLDLTNLTAAMGGTVPNGTEYPYIVLKVRSGELFSRTFCLYGGTSTSNAKPASEASLRTAHVKNTDDWQYIYFQLPGNVTTLYLRFEYAIGALGENMDIAEFRFVKTVEEADALCGEDVYPLENPTLTEGDLRVISYNIWVGHGTDINLRADIFRNFLDTYQPDSIGMQEVTSAWRTAFQNRTVFNDSYTGVGVPRDSGGEASMIYYRSDKYDLVDSGTFWLSDTPDVSGSKIDGSEYVRICTWVHLRNRTTGEEYVHLNTHLDTASNKVREPQLKVILQFVAEKFPDVPAVLTGDFNARAANDEGKIYNLYKYMIGEKNYDMGDGTTLTSPFSDARTDAEQIVYAAGGTASMTKYFDESNSAYDPDRLPIDYQLHTDHLKAILYRTELNNPYDQFMSDHLPLICDYSFQQTT